MILCSKKEQQVMGMESAQEELASALSDTSGPPFSPSYVCTVITDRC